MWGREEWRPVLASEVKRWAEKSCEQLISELGGGQVYEVEKYAADTQPVNRRALTRSKDARMKYGKVPGVEASTNEALGGPMTVTVCTT